MNVKNFFYRLANWETWHYLVKYIPIMPVWAWHGLKVGSPWFFTPSNPTLTFGGFEGESKKEMYEQLPAGTYPNSIYITAGTPFKDVLEKIEQSGIKMPFAVKPDVGMMGYMFRRITEVEKLQYYHAKMDVDYIVQELALYPHEVSVFYYRMPGSTKGTVSGFLKKEYLEVSGDGRSTLRQLIMNYDRVRFRLEEMLSKHQLMLDTILPNHEIYILSHALNLSRGGRFVSLKHEINDELIQVFDNISLHTKHFYYGRYDIKCASVRDLQQGKNFTILEYNGCGAEPHHAYGNGLTLIQAYRIFLHHWKILSKISRMNRKKGVEYWPLMRGFRFLSSARKHFKKLKQLDIETGTW